jgi:Holliday junction resolvase RusA-like endonuclease
MYRSSIHYRSGKPYTYKTPDAKRWEHDASLLIKQAYGRQAPFTTDLEVTLELHLTRKRDIDSSHKALFDALEQSGVIENDNQIAVLHTYRYMDKSDKVVLYAVSVATTAI